MAELPADTWLIGPLSATAGGAPRENPFADEPIADAPGDGGGNAADHVTPETRTLQHATSADSILLRPNPQTAAGAPDTGSGDAEAPLLHPNSAGAAEKPPQWRPGVYYGPSRPDATDTYDPPRETDGDDAAGRDFQSTGRRVVYENFTTIDWIHDFAKGRLRQKALRGRAAEGWSGYMQLWYDAAQAWVLVALVGAATGVLVGFTTIAGEWLGDAKDGYCRAGFYLNKRACCGYAVQREECGDWTPWAHRTPGVPSAVSNYAMYVTLAVLFATASATLVQSFAPYAAGSGIPEIKTILSGFVIRKFLGAWTLLVKCLGLALSTASGLNLGKEGPFVHVACCAGNILARLFGKYRHNEAKKREVLSAAAAAGVSCAFGAPIGGVLFALEEVSYYFPYKTLWRAFFCAMTAALALETMNPYHTKKIVLFQVTYSRAYHAFELPFFVLLGCAGGLLGTLFIRLNRNVALLRRTTRLGAHPALEVAVVAGLTAVVGYMFRFTRVSAVELVANLFRECEEVDYDFHGICDTAQVRSTVAALLAAAAIKLFFTVFTFGLRVPAGIFIPSMAIGACLGRALGLAIQTAQTSFPNAFMFAACPSGNEPCVTPGVYAMVGAAAMLGGVTRMTISLAVIMFELTGQLSYVLPTMLTLLTSKWVADSFGRRSIYDTLIELNRFPFLESKDDGSDSTPAAAAMTPLSHLELLCAARGSTTLGVVERLLALPGGGFKGYPVVDGPATRRIVGFCGTAELRYAVEHARHTRPDLGPAAPLRLGPDVPPDPTAVDLVPWINRTPFTIGQQLPMDMVRDLFVKMGLRYVLVVHDGRLAGLLTKKDLLRHQRRRADRAAASAAATAEAAAARRRARPAALAGRFFAAVAALDVAIARGRRRASVAYAADRTWRGRLTHGPALAAYWFAWFLRRVFTLRSPYSRRPRRPNDPAAGSDTELLGDAAYAAVVDDDATFSDDPFDGEAQNPDSDDDVASVSRWAAGGRVQSGNEPADEAAVARTRYQAWRRRQLEHGGISSPPSLSFPPGESLETPWASPEPISPSGPL